MDDLKLIKRHYGENMMHLCRELFPTLLETPGLLFGLISNKFAYTKYLYDDLVEFDNISDFKSVIYSQLVSDKDKEEVTESPQELMDKVGYTLYECHTEKDIQKYKKYYADGEELCTFRGGRLKSCHVFFAVKKNVDEIKRENFDKPERQDEYGTSVISIQFSKGRYNTLSIKNRYNHTVPNPDSTFSNNLENICEGLTAAFENKYGYNTIYEEAEVEIQGYVLAKDGKYYRYNFENNNVYYCSNNIIVDNFQIVEFDKSRYLVMDNFILDYKEKEIFEYAEDLMDRDSFLDSIGKIESIQVLRNKKTNKKTITINNDIVIGLNEFNQIISYSNPHIEEIYDNFMMTSPGLEKLSLPNVRNIGDEFLINNDGLTTLDLPNVVNIGSDFLATNVEIKDFNLPKVESIGKSFMVRAHKIKKVDLPKLKEIGTFFLTNGCDIKSVNLPNVEIIDDGFLGSNIALRKISLPKCKEIGDCFLSQTYQGGNKYLRELYLPNVKTVGNYFLKNNLALKKLDLPNCKTMGSHILFSNRIMTELNLPKVKKIGYCSFVANRRMKKVNLPKVEKIGTSFFYDNKIIEKINMPMLKLADIHFLYNNKKLTELNLPSITYVGSGICELNRIIESVNMPNAKTIGDCFLKENRRIKSLSLPNATNIGKNFLFENRVLSELELPKAKIIQDSFLKCNINLKYLSLPCIKEIGPFFLIRNRRFDAKQYVKEKERKSFRDIEPKKETIPWDVWMQF